jgi:Fanconi-associated nuclease 1
MGNAPLARLCTVLAEDYSLGTAGMPDLFVWDVAGKRSMFVEVKGPGDTLQENQKVRLGFANII